MRIAFYAPMKPPSDPVPSGDRRMARLIMHALRGAGHQVRIASEMRSRDGKGDPDRQARLKHVGERAARRLIERYSAAPAAVRPEAWFTYHLYHKAPDWLGPAVSAALSIPYIVAEASSAPKQGGGPWAAGHAAAAAAIGRADAIVEINSNDAAFVRPLMKPGAALVPLRPFLDTGPFAAAAAEERQRARLADSFGLDAERPILLAVAMMRHRDKFASYRLLRDALGRLGDLDWQLLVVGDGPARRAVEAALRPLGRTTYAGEIPTQRLPAIYAGADLFVWPALREAYGMALLEAQAAGLVVVAGRAGGVGDIVRDGETGLLAPEGDPAAFATAVRELLTDPDRRRAMGRRALAVTAAEHSFASASAILDRAVRAACAARADAAL